MGWRRSAGCFWEILWEMQTAFAISHLTRCLHCITKSLPRLLFASILLSYTFLCSAQPQNLKDQKGRWWDYVLFPMEVGFSIPALHSDLITCSLPSHCNGPRKPLINVRLQQTRRLSVERSPPQNGSGGYQSKCQ